MEIKGVYTCVCAVNGVGFTAVLRLIRGQEKAQYLEDDSCNSKTIETVHDEKNHDGDQDDSHGSRRW